LKPITEELRKLADDPIEFTMLAELLRDPHRVYRGDQGQEGTYKALRSYLIAGSEPAVAIATLKLSGKGPNQEVSVSATFLRDIAEEDLVPVLEEMFREVDPAERTGDAFREEKKSILWIGESGRIGHGNWKDQLSAVGEARGLSVDFAPNPTSFNSTHMKIEKFRGERIVIWTPTAGVFANRASLPSRAGENAALLTDSDFTRSVEELRAQLDTPKEEAAIEPGRWKEVHDKVSALQSEAFSVTSRCLKSLEGNPYPDPAKMFRFLKDLASAAEEWQRRQGDIGDRFDRWAYAKFGIRIALHDSNLGDWTAFEHEGQEYSREPHVKVDDHTSPGKCGRIYFALDKEKTRVIVDYVGLHP
jgi:hypothetical protein